MSPGTIADPCCCLCWDCKNKEYPGQFLVTFEGITDGDDCTPCDCAGLNGTWLLTFRPLCVWQCGGECCLACEIPVGKGYGGFTLGIYAPGGGPPFRAEVVAHNSWTPGSLTWMKEYDERPPCIDLVDEILLPVESEGGVDMCRHLDSTCKITAVEGCPDPAPPCVYGPCD